MNDLPIGSANLEYDRDTNILTLRIVYRGEAAAAEIFGTFAQCLKDGAIKFDAGTAAFVAFERGGLQ